MSARDAILSRIRAATAAETAAALSAAPAGSPLPEPAFGNCFERFRDLALATNMTVARVRGPAALPAAVREYVDREKLGRKIFVDASIDLRANSWADAQLNAASPPVAADGDIYVGHALAAIADCGALVIASGAGRQLTQEFLASTHIAVVAESMLLPTLDSLWALLRARKADASLPRAVVLVTGPSRTADLGVPAKLGAHGPARVHVLVVADDQVSA